MQMGDGAIEVVVSSTIFFFSQVGLYLKYKSSDFFLYVFKEGS